MEGDFRFKALYKIDELEKENAQLRERRDKLQELNDSVYVILEETQVRALGLKEQLAEAQGLHGVVKMIRDDLLKSEGRLMDERASLKTKLKEAQGHKEKGVVESMSLGTELGIARADLRIARERIAELEGLLKRASSFLGEVPSELLLEEIENALQRKDKSP